MAAAHTKETPPGGWRGHLIEYRHAQTQDLDRALTEVENLTAALAGDEKFVTAARSFAALMRDRRNELESDARRLEIEIREAAA